MPARCVRESRLTPHLEAHIAANHRYFAYDLIRVSAVAVDWHVVRQFGHAFLGQKPSDQNVRLRKIHLAHTRVRELRTNLEMSTVLIVQQSGKNGWRVEVRIAQKIDRTVHSNQPDGLHVPDHTVVFDGFKRHRQRASYFKRPDLGCRWSACGPALRRTADQGLPPWWDA